ncbi:MAG: peptide chain release factor N(5)-glutamine methyltransferase, partial [Pygmaiobacter sp.]
DTVSSEQSTRLRQLVAMRSAHVPLQYLLGEWGFYNVVLQVGEGVLIPRQDTEIVVETALGLIQNKCAPRVVDLCAGSGAIGVALRHERRDAAVLCVELSDKAMPYLVRNAKTEGVQVQCADVFGFEATLVDDALDLIVANPPYVSAAEYASLAPELYKEPKMALVAAQDGLLFYDYIARNYKTKLAPGGALCFEIGASQRHAVCEFLSQNGFIGIDSVQDLGGNDRCVW